MEKIVVDDLARLDEFYEDCSLTFIGVIEEEIGLYLDFLRQFSKVNDRVYWFKAKLMNEKYGLTGDNRYPEDTNFMVIKLGDIEEVGKIAIPRFKIGGRWFNDIVDNNARREMEK